MKQKRMAFIAAIALSFMTVCPMTSNAQGRMMDLVSSNEVAQASTKSVSLNPKIVAHSSPEEMYSALKASRFTLIRCEEGYDEINGIDEGTTCYYQRNINGKKIDIIIVDDGLTTMKFSDPAEMKAFVSALMSYGFTTKDRRSYCCDRYYTCFSIENNNTLNFWYY